ncbi:MAG TPA: hypothetical protein VL120_09000 [Solirubrobacteraceae bacterium]|nr:hypothetical protein [Solirubrobacteraceae bacterium]
MAPRAAVAFLRQFPPTRHPQEITMFRNRLATTALTAALAVVPAAALVTAGADAAPVKPTYGSAVHGICAKSAVVTKTPGKGILGNLLRNETIKVKRVSPSGTYVYGFARGTANKNGWVKTAALCPRSGGLGDPRVKHPSIY